ncbi:filamin-C-like [Schistocerca gregaria]|uniref:filamin-C-like n=1 Tax=Schistocerca gregaria TaxID=7010 RepID=UPI00211ED77D|nr:filamin-C-like [Schistocerca gregaria]XP_049847873.1 filamin-C-like [Schistocerca gregaria]
MSNALNRAKSDEGVPDWVRIQTKTFTRWCNKIVDGKNGHVFTCLEEDFADGISFNILVSCLVNQNLIIHPSPKTNFAKLENLNRALYVLTEMEKVTLINISAEDLLNKNKKLVLGLVWTLIQKYQIAHQTDLKLKTKSVLLNRVNDAIRDSNVSVSNFSDQWKDTAAFSALVNSISPNAFDVVRLDEEEKCIKKLSSIFDYADKNLEITNLLDAEDVVKYPDELSLMSYISMYLNCLEKKRAGSVDPSRVVAEGPGIEEAVVGTEASFRVITRTKPENSVSDKCEVTAELAKVTESPDGQEGVPVKIEQLEDGVYRGSYIAQEPGLYNLKVSVNGQPINASPFQVSAKEPAINPEDFRASGEGVECAISEKDTDIVVERVDGAPIRPGVAFEAYVEIDKESKIPIELTPLGDRGYSGRYALKDVRGDAEVFVNVMMNSGGESFHVKGSPYAVKFYSPEKGNVEVIVDECPPVVAGEPICVRIRARDRFGDLRPVPGLRLEAELESDPPVKVDVVDKGDGDYECSLVQTKAGKYPLAVSMQGKPVSSAAFVEVVPDVPCSDKTSIYLLSDFDDDEHKFSVGEHIKGQVLINDQYNNQITNEQVPVSLEVVSPTGKKVDVETATGSDGILNFSLVPDEQGLHSLFAKIGEGDAEKPSFELNISEGDKELKVWMCEDTKSTFKAGENVCYILHTEGWSGKKLKDGQISLSAKLPDAAVEYDLVEPDANGDPWMIVCKFLPYVAGSFELKTDVCSKTQSRSFSFPIQVVPAEPDPQKSTLMKSSPNRVYAGNTWQCKFSLKDRYENPITEGALFVDIKVTQVLDQDNAPSVCDNLNLKGVVTPSPTLSIIENKDGVYTVECEPIKTAGKYRLYVMLGGTPIENSPSSFSVKPLATISPEMCYLVGVADGRVGEEQTVTLVCRDEFGNLTGSRKVHVNAKLVGPEQVQTHVAYQQDGVYAISCCPTLAGEYTYRVSLDKKKVDLGASGLPYKLQLDPADVDGASCTATGKGLYRAKSSVNSGFRIQLRDRFGNPHKTNPGVSTDSYLLFVSGDSLALVTSDLPSDPIPVSLSDAGDGTIEAKYQTSRSGEYALHVLVQEKPIQKSPFSVKATAGPYYIDHTLTQFPEKNVAGRPGPVVKLCDQAKNICTKNKSTPKAVLEPKNHAEFPFAKDGPVSYTLTYPPDLTGDYDVHIQVDGQEVPGSPWPVNIEKCPLDEQDQQMLKNMLPESADVIISCLEQVDETKRCAIIKELQGLSKIQNRHSVHINHPHKDKKKRSQQEQ